MSERKVNILFTINFGYFSLLGDEIDAQYQEEMREIVALTGSPDSAFKMFTEVAQNLFEWNEQGGGICVFVCMR